MSSTTRDVAYTFSSRICSMLVSIWTHSILCLAIGPDKRGEYAVCLLFSSLLSIVCMIGCDVACIYFVSSKKYTISEGIIYLFMLVGLCSLVAIGMGFTIMNFPLAFLDKAPRYAFYLALFSIPITKISSTLALLLTATQRFKLYAMVASLQAIVQLLLTFVIVKWLDFGVCGAIATLMINGLVFIAVLLLLFKIKMNTSWQNPTYTKTKEMVCYGLRYYIGKISNTVNVQVGTIILSFVASKPEIGIFSVAMQLTSKIMLFPDTLGVVLFPKSARDKEGKSELFAHCARISFLVCGVALSILFVLAKPLVLFLFKEEFLATVPLIQILCVGVFIRCVCKIFVPYLIGRNRPEIASASVVVGMATNIVLLWLLLPKYGIKGAAIGVATSYLASSLLLLVAFIYFSGMNFFQIMAFRKNDFQFVSSLKQKIFKAK